MDYKAQNDLELRSTKINILWRHYNRLNKSVIYKEDFFSNTPQQGIIKIPKKKKMKISSKHIFRKTNYIDRSNKNQREKDDHDIDKLETKFKTDTKIPELNNTKYSIFVDKISRQDNSWDYNGNSMFNKSDDMVSYL